jgi:DNA-binding NtrC family response regulator
MILADRNLTVLAIEDDEGVRQSIASYLEDIGLKVIQASGGREGIELFERLSPDIVFTDLMMPEVDGLVVLEEISKKSPETPVVVISANSSVTYAIEAVRKGAWDYITKPIRDFSELDQLIMKMMSRAGELKAESTTREDLGKAYKQIRELQEQLKAKSQYLMEEIRLTRTNNEIIGQSQAIKKLFKQIDQVAGTDSTVLIHGETGTGKELVARAIHDLSKCKDRALVKVDCASLPSTLIEGELFGRERGAYTGALTMQLGRFEVANNTTIFLDEIGELSLELQTKLLRILQDGEFERLGSSKTIKVNVRVVAATNRNLAEMVKLGKFREDLYYRLNVFPIETPPLRTRQEDIPLLVWAFVRKQSEKMGKKILQIQKRSMDVLQQHYWPGNVRELQNIVEQALIKTTGETLIIKVPEEAALPSLSLLTLEQMEYNHITQALKATGWRIKGPGGVAELLGLNPSTLYSRMKKLGISSSQQRDDISS